MDSSPAVIAAIIATLQANTALQALVSGRIYTDVPQKTSFPYLVLSLSSEPFAASDFSGQAHILTIQAFSQEASFKQVGMVRKGALDALDRQEASITLTGFTLVKCEYAGSLRPFKEDDGKTWQAISELQIVVV